MNFEEQHQYIFQFPNDKISQTFVKRNQFFLNHQVLILPLIGIVSLIQLLIYNNII